jgi:hypothetical protein
MILQSKRKTLCLQKKLQTKRKRRKNARPCFKSGKLKTKLNQSSSRFNERKRIEGKRKRDWWKLSIVRKSSKDKYMRINVKLNLESSKCLKKMKLEKIQSLRDKNTSNKCHLTRRFSQTKRLKPQKKYKKKWQSSKRRHFCKKKK